MNPKYDLHMLRLSYLQSLLEDWGCEVDLYAMATKPPFLTMVVDEELTGEFRYLELDEDMMESLLILETELPTSGLSDFQRQALCATCNEQLFGVTTWPVADEHRVMVRAVFPENFEEINDQVFALFLNFYSANLDRIKECLAMIKEGNP